MYACVPLYSSVSLSLSIPLSVSVERSDSVSLWPQKVCPALLVWSGWIASYFRLKLFARPTLAPMSLRIWALDRGAHTHTQVSTFELEIYLQDDLRLRLLQEDVSPSDQDVTAPLQIPGRAS